MKKLLFFWCLISCLNFSYAQPGFYKVFSGIGYDKGEGVIQLTDSTYLVTGSSSSFEDAPDQAFLMLLDKYGNHMWSKAYGGAESETGRRVMAVGNDGFYVAGTSTSGTSHDFDAYFFKTNVAGDLVWSQTVDNGGWERIHDAIMMPDTTIIAIGETTNNATQNSDIYLIRLSKTGAVIWQKQFGSSQDDNGLAVEKITDSTFVIGGTYYITDSTLNKGYTALYHIDGTQVWETFIGPNGNYQINDVLLEGTEIHYVGERKGSGASEFDETLGVLDLNGVLLYEYQYINTNNTTRLLYAQPYTSSSGLKHIIAAQFIDPNFTFPNGEDAFIIRYNNLYQYDGYGSSYSGTEQDQFNQLSPTLDGKVVGVGYHTTIGANTGGNSIFVVKIKDDSSFPLAPINPTIYNILSENELLGSTSYRCTPNPFKDELNIHVSNIETVVEMYNLEGKKVLTQLVSDTEILNTAQLQAGVYFIKLCNEKGIIQLKMMKQ